MKPIKFLLSAVVALFISGSAFAQGNGDIKVIVVDESGKPMEYATVVLTTGGASRGGGQTDKNGILFFRGLKPSGYDVKVNMLGYKGYLKHNVTVEAGQTAEVSYKMQPSDATTMAGVTIEANYEKSPVPKEFSSIQNIDAGTIKNGAFQPGDVTGMVTATCSSCNTGRGGQLVMRGSREGASQVFVDGEKMYGSSNVPGLSIQQVSILSGGVPAEYGDFSGGAIIITTQDFLGGMQTKQNMRQQAAEEEELKKQEEAKKKGTIKEENGTIIEDNSGGH